MRHPEPQSNQSTTHTVYIQTQVALASAAELTVPPIAWPTVGVFLAGCALYALPPLLTWHNPSPKVGRSVRVFCTCG
jgi:hypothetical protein